MIESETILQERANLFKALGHPARLQILQFLSKSKTCISGDISEEIPLSRTTLKQHLRELKEVRLIRGQVEGSKTNYCLDYENIATMKIIFGSFMDEIQVPDNYCCT